jgi:glycosyltransferase involved in cell wall biosynthesis
LKPEQRSLLRKLTPLALRQAMQPLRLGLIERGVTRALLAPEPGHVRGDIVVSGLLSGGKGVSQAARLTVDGLRAAGWPVIAHDIEPVLKAGPGAGETLPFTCPGGVWLAHINAPECLLALACLAPEAWRGRYRIGYWAWELPVAPPLWARVASAFHELWAPSSYAASALKAAGVTCPVHVIPHPAHLLAAAPAPARARWGLADRSLAVLAMGELDSSVTRKNLAGAAAIYRRAFPEPVPGGPCLILKTWSDTPGAPVDALIDGMRAGRPDIRFLTDRLPHAAVLELIASCDVVLSPHRAEGFGLVLAEAFVSGVPALATGWSGNLDFMSGLDPLLIASRPTPVRDSSGVYRDGTQSWADPDVADGAMKLAALAASPDLRAEMARQGRARVAAMAGAWARERLLAGAIGRWSSGAGS